MTMTVKDLMKEKYAGVTVRSILTNPAFRKRVLADPSVRGNQRAKELVMDKIAVGGKVLLTGPTGEAKTLFARILLEHLTREINNRKFHIKGSPFLEDAGYIIHVINNYSKNPLTSISVLQSLSPFVKERIEELLRQENPNLHLDNTDDVIKLGKRLPTLLKELEVEKTIVRMSQIDPRTDPESLYMLIAGVENLEKLLGGETSETFNASAHKVGVLSQGFLVVNEIQRLPLSLLEALMGFLEDPQGIKYNLLGIPVYIDGAIIFTSNAPLTVFGEESQPIINRVPEVLWPARSVQERVVIIRDMFKDHLVASRRIIPANPSIIKMYESIGDEEKKDWVSRLAVEFLAEVASESIPDSLKEDKITKMESRIARIDFYAGLDEIHNPQKSPHIDLRTLNNAVGEIVIRTPLDEEGLRVITLDKVRETMENYDVNPKFINNALQSLKTNLRSFLREGKDAIKAEEVTEDLDRMAALTEEQLVEVIAQYEGIEKYPPSLKEKLVATLKPMYEQLLRIDYL